MIMKYIENGGIIMYILIAMNFTGISIAIWKFLVFQVHKKKGRETAQSTLGQAMKISDEKSTVINLAKEKISNYVQSLEGGMTVIKIIASVAPLLGLLGTAIGVLNSFHSISMMGLKNPTLFAGGISMALVTTVAGLIVAIPHFIIYNYFNGWLNNYEVELEESIINHYMQKAV